MAKAPATPEKPAAKPRTRTKAAPPVPQAALSDLPAATTAPTATDWVKVGVGVGSAALVAALLYATRSKPKDWTKG